MSSKSIAARAGPVTKRRAFTEDETIKWLKTDARAPANADPIEIDKHIYRLVSRLLPRGSQQIWQLLIRHWAPRFESPVSDDTSSLILELVTAAHAAILKADDDEKHRKAEKESADLKRRIDERARAREAEKDDSKKEFVAKIVKALECTTDYAYKLLRRPEDGGGTTKPETAAVVAKITGEPAVTYLRQPKRPGRRTIVADLLNRYFIEGATLFDYVQSDPKLDGDPGKLAVALKAGYADGRIVERHYRTSDHFRRSAARLLEFNTETAEAFWFEFQRWRVDIVAAIYRFEIETECLG